MEATTLEQRLPEIPVLKALEKKRKSSVPKFDYFQTILGRIENCTKPERLKHLYTKPERLEYFNFEEESKLIDWAIQLAHRMRFILSDQRDYLSERHFEKAQEYVNIKKQKKDIDNDTTRRNAQRILDAPLYLPYSMN